MLNYSWYEGFYFFTELEKLYVNVFLSKWEIVLFLSIWKMMIQQEVGWLSCSIISNWLVHWPIGFHQSQCQMSACHMLYSKIFFSPIIFCISFKLYYIVAVHILLIKKYFCSVVTSINNVLINCIFSCLLQVAIYL